MKIYYDVIQIYSDGSEEVLETFKKEIDAQNYADEIYEQEKSNDKPNICIQPRFEV